MFDWLSDLIRGLGKLIPRIVLVRSTYEGVFFFLGRHEKLITSKNGLFQTGIHFYWPIICEVDTVPIRRQTTRLEKQYLSTKDEVPVGICGVLVYEVADTLKLLTECFDYEDTIRDLSLFAIREIVKDNTFDDLLNNALLDKELTALLRKKLKRFGVRTIRFNLSDIVRMRVIGLWGIHERNSTTQQSYDY